MSTTLLDLTPFAMLVADGRASVHAVNQGWVDISGLTQGDSLGGGWLGAIDDDHHGRLLGDVARVAATGESAKCDYPISGPSGTRWARWWISRHDIDGAPQVVITAADVHEEQAEQADLYRLATHDSLTGLLNRRSFIEAVEQAVRRTERNSQPVCLLYVDLDHFKDVNDRAGHCVGDGVLAAIAGRLRLAVRSADLVARVGGDEFAVLVDGVEESSQIDAVARRVESALNGFVEVDGSRWPIAASVGAAVSNRRPVKAIELISEADHAMYETKRRRRSTAVHQAHANQTLEQFAALRQTVESMQKTIERLLSVELNVPTRPG